MEHPNWTIALGSNSLIYSMANQSILVYYSAALPETQSNVTCEDGSVALKELLRRHRDWFPEENPSSTETGLDFNYVFEGIMGYQIEDFPDNFLCDFESKFRKHEFSSHTNIFCLYLTELTGLLIDKSALYLFNIYIIMYV